jgi:hypothetical protein
MIPGLEGVDWLSLLDEMMVEGEDEEDGNEGKKGKYVPQEIPLLSPAAALAARERAARRRGEGGVKGGEGEGPRLPTRTRHVQVVRDPEIQVREGMGGRGRDGCVVGPLV